MTADTTDTAAPEAPAGQPQPGRRGGAAVYGLVILGTTVFLNSLDQLVLPAVAGGIQREFGLSDTAIGTLLGAFVVALALGALPIGLLADRASRKLVISAGVAVWSLATLATGLAGSFAQMLVARAVVGIGEASSQPAGTSLLGDYFPARTRGRAMAAVIACAGLGTGCGLILGGVVGNSLGWRAAFWFAGIPGLVVAVLVLTLREPLRGAGEAAGPARTAPVVSLADVGRLFRNRTYVLVLLAGTFGLFSQGTSQLITLYLNRRFGLDMQQASALPGTPLLIGGVIGTPIWGWIIDRRSRRSARGPVEIAAATTFVCAAACVVMFAAPSVSVFAAGVFVFGIVQWAFILVPFVLIQNVVAPQLRASATSLTVTSGRLFGSALGPVLVGALSDALGGNLGLSLLILSPAALLLSGLCLLPALGTVKSDTENMARDWGRVAGGSVPAGPAAARAAV